MLISSEQYCKSSINKNSWTKYGPCSLRAVNIIDPVSSPMRHSAMRETRPGGGESIAFDGKVARLARAFIGTSFELTTFTVRLWPLVPGWRRSIFVNTGFRFSVTAGAEGSFGAYVACLGAALDLLAIAKKIGWKYWAWELWLGLAGRWQYESGAAIEG